MKVAIRLVMTRIVAIGLLMILTALLNRSLAFLRFGWWQPPFALVFADDNTNEVTFLLGMLSPWAMSLIVHKCWPKLVKFSAGVAAVGVVLLPFVLISPFIFTVHYGNKPIHTLTVPPNHRIVAYLNGAWAFDDNWVEVACETPVWPAMMWVHRLYREPHSDGVTISFQEPSVLRCSFSQTCRGKSLEDDVVLVHL